MKKLLIIPLICSLMLGITHLTHASISYSRIPAGAEITSPVNVSVSVDNLTDIFSEPTPDYWGLFIGDNNNGFFGTCLASTTLSTFYNFILPVGTQAVEVRGLGFHEAGCPFDSIYTDVFFEGNGNDTLFTIVSGTPDLFSMPMASTSEALASTGTLGIDLWTIIALAIGLPLGFYVIRRIIHLTQ